MGKKKTMDNAIEWLRNSDPEDLQDTDNPSLSALTNLAGVPMPGASKTDRVKILMDAVDWLRNNDPIITNVDKPGLKSLTKLGGIHMPKKLTPETKQRAIDDFMDWLRNNKLNPNHIDDATFKALTNLAGVSMPGAHLTPEEQKTKAIEDSS